jgi:hypothetical protein
MDVGPRELKRPNTSSIAVKIFIHTSVKSYKVEVTGG